MEQEMIIGEIETQFRSELVLVGEPQTNDELEVLQGKVLHHSKVMGQERANFPVLAHTLHPSSNIDDLLELDFLRGQELNIDFRQGQIKLW